MNNCSWNRSRGKSKTLRQSIAATSRKLAVAVKVANNLQDIKVALVLLNAGIDKLELTCKKLADI
jgi:hypothetical protein